MRARSSILMVACTLALVWLPSGATAGGFCRGGGPEGFTNAKGTVVEMKDYCFSPTVLRVEAGETVTFLNADPAIHGVGGAAGSFGDAHEEIAVDGRVTYRFDEEGVFPYTCIFHPGMTGAVVVGDGKGKVAARSATVVPPVPPDANSAEGLPAAPASTTKPAGANSAPLALALGIAVILLISAIAALHSARREDTDAVASASM
ncbi:MAG: hypothetical protein M3345_01635 [Actinomycetota bacterium]|nr:hypothetical protein [Actinomycetota bacterium]